jgi:hypothetical protein
VNLSKKKNRRKRAKVRYFRFKGIGSDSPEFSCCYRVPDRKRRAAEKSQYKKGFEARLHLPDDSSVSIARRFLESKGVSCGKAYLHHRGYSARVLPIYGKESIDRFEKLIVKARDNR